MGLVEGGAEAGEGFGDIGGDGPALLGGEGGDGGFEGDSGGDFADHGEAAGQLVGGEEEGFFILLHVAVVGHGGALDGDVKGGQAAEDAAGLAADEFERVGIFLLRHEAGAAGDAVAELHPAELFA